MSYFSGSVEITPSFVTPGRKMRDYEFLQLCMTNTITEADGLSDEDFGGYRVKFRTRK